MEKILRIVAVAALAMGLMMSAGCAGTGGADSSASDGRSAKSASETAEGNAGKFADVPAPSTAGALHVDGAQLVGEDGQPVQLRGVSTHGLAWFPQYVNQEFFHELRRDWGANVVRLAMYTAESGGYCTDGDRVQLEQLVTDGITFATEADLYVVMDWHILSDSNPLQNLDDAKAFFDKMSKRFANNTNVIYEICNEPNGATTWSDIAAYASEIIPVIRMNAPNAVVIVGTPTWSQDVDKAAANPLAFDNVMYALHFYAATHQQDLRERMAAAVNAGLPVFVSEFGICDASGNGAIDYASADAWVRLMDELDVSYICWNLSNKDEASALFKANCAKVSGFDAADLSAEGAWLWAVLHGDEPDTAGENGGAVGAAVNGTSDGCAGDLPNAGAFSGSVGDLSFAAKVVNSWEAGGRTHKQYSLTLSNDGSAIDSWEVTVPIGHAFSLVDSWNGKFDIRGTDLHVTNVGYNGAIPAGGSVSDVGFIVSY